MHSASGKKIKKVLINFQLMLGTSIQLGHKSGDTF